MKKPVEPKVSSRIKSAERKPLTATSSSSSKRRKSKSSDTASKANRPTVGHDVTAVAQALVPHSMALDVYRPEPWLAQSYLAHVSASTLLSESIRNMYDPASSIADLLLKKGAEAEKSDNEKFSLDLHEIMRDVNSGRFLEHLPADFVSAFGEVAPQQWPADLSTEPYEI